MQTRYDTENGKNANQKYRSLVSNEEANLPLMRAHAAGENTPAFALCE